MKKKKKEILNNKIMKDDPNLGYINDKLRCLNHNGNYWLNYKQGF
jgi:hypothetical protein